jgi:hypothetical protein
VTAHPLATLIFIYSLLCWVLLLLLLVVVVGCDGWFVLEMAVAAVGCCAWVGIGVVPGDR